MADMWRRTFVVSHLNLDFSRGYMDCAILIWRMCLWYVAECCNISDKSARWFYTCRHVWKVCKWTFLYFAFLAKRLTQAIVVILRLLHVLWGGTPTFCIHRRRSNFFTFLHTSSAILYHILLLYDDDDDDDDDEVMLNVLRCQLTY